MSPQVLRRTEKSKVFAFATPLMLPATEPPGWNTNVSLTVPPVRF